MKKGNSKKGLIIGGIVLVALIAVFAVIYFKFLPETTAGEKNITVEVIFADGTSKTFAINTEQEYLRGALEEQEIVAGAESEYGLYILTVDGVTADESLQQWWCVTKGGGEVYTGVDATPIEDGDQFELTLETGW